MLGTLWIAAALAGEELHPMGFLPVPGEAPLDPLLTWPAMIETRCGAVVGMACEATRVISTLRDDAGEPLAITTPSLAATHLSARMVLNRRFALALGVPMRLDADPRVASVRLSAMVGAVPTNGGNFGIYVIPTLEIPTQGELGYVGANALAGGGVLAAGYGWERSRVDLNLGVYQSAPYAPAGRQGFTELSARLAAGHKPPRAPALRAELLTRYARGTPGWPATSPPLELVLSARQSAGPLRLTVGAALGGSPTVSALAYRGFVSVDLAYRCPEESGIAIPDPPPPCLGGEVVNGFQDQDGCPDSLATLEIRVYGEDGRPRPDAVLTLGDERFTADERGRVIVPDQMPWTYARFSVDAPGARALETHMGPLQEGLNPKSVTLHAGGVGVRADFSLPSAVLFAFDSDQLLPAAEPALRALLKILSEHPELGTIEVQGHTDDVGSSTYNLDLSTRRAEAVRAWLLAQGLPPDRVKAVGYGEARPVAPNDTATGRAANRRVEVVLNGGGS